jgi:hypothetical protein
MYGFFKVIRSAVNFSGKMRSIGCFQRATSKNCRWLFATVLLTTTLPLAAREINVSVTDGDLEEPLKGATLHLPDGTEVPTDDKGVAYFNVPDELYGEISITYPGYESGRILLTDDGENSFTLTMRMSVGVLENKELVIEEYRPDANRTRNGRSVSLNRENLERSSEIGLIEDIMSSIKLLPGVSYTGLFNAQPSIRGGIPGDMKAVLDGFYIDNPYHWGGGFSIFDPKTVESAQLHHGVFSARYTHTISGLLEIVSWRPSSEHFDFGLTLSTSAAGFNISHPLPDFSDFNAANRGGIMLIGKITYWDPFIYLAKSLSEKIAILEPINAISLAPYVRSLNLLSNYRFSTDIELNLNAYIGGDGVGVVYDNSSGNIDVLTDSSLKLDWENLIFFITTNLLFNPNPDMIIKANLGVSYSSQFMDTYNSYTIKSGDDSTNTPQVSAEKYDYRTTGLQARIDFDWDIGNGFLFSAGIEELYRNWHQSIVTNAMIDVTAEDKNWYSFARIYPEIQNTGLFSGLYSLVEYKDAAGRFSAEAGLRLDHLYIIGNGFSIQTLPVVNPRINFDYYLLRNRSFIDLLALTAGTGLFSAINENIAYLDKIHGINDFDLKQNSSSTSIAGIQIDFLSVWSFNLEFYYKYIFDRTYNRTIASFEDNRAITEYNFNGTGHILGFDIILQKMNGRFIDGWVSYSFNYARYHDPKSNFAFRGAKFTDTSDHWYFPSFHRFSNLNLVLNFKPFVNFNIYMRFGFASGVPQAEAGPVTSYELHDNDGGGSTGKVKYTREYFYSDNVRSGFSLPLDVKFSWSFFYPNQKVRTEIYFAVENMLSLIYRPKKSTTLNPYTGKEEESSNNLPSFELPIPMVSFGFKWSY